MKHLATFCFVLAGLSGAAASPRTYDGAAIAGGGPFPPEFDAIQVHVLTPSCALSWCHGDAMSANMDLREGAAYSNIVNVPSVEVPSLMRIEPFAPDESYLVCKLEACPAMLGSQMPLIGGPLDPAVIGVIREWVSLGAPETPISVEGSSWGRVKSMYR